MSVKKTIRTALYIFSYISLSACATQADPTPYLNFDCEQLRVMASPQTQIDPFEANRVGPDPQAGLSGDRAGLRKENEDAAQKRDDDARAIRAAYRQKGCKT